MHAAETAKGSVIMASYSRINQKLAWGKEPQGQLAI